MLLLGVVEVLEKAPSQPRNRPVRNERYQQQDLPPEVERSQAEQSGRHSKQPVRNDRGAPEPAIPVQPPKAVQHSVAPREQRVHTEQQSSAQHLLSGHTVPPATRGVTASAATRFFPMVSRSYIRTT